MTGQNYLLYIDLFLHFCQKVINHVEQERDCVYVWIARYIFRITLQLDGSLQFDRVWKSKEDGALADNWR